jgi:hypothetical protein
MRQEKKLKLLLKNPKKVKIKRLTEFLEETKRSLGYSGGDVTKMPIIGSVITKAIGHFSEGYYDIVEVIQDAQGKEIYIANSWYKSGVPQLIHSDLVKQFNPLLY